MASKKICVLFAILLSMVGTKAFAYVIAVENADGKTIYYNYINDGKELEVTHGSYSGVVVIPEEVTFMNRTRKVTAIGYRAFEECGKLTSVTIPNSVTSIGESAFYGCSGLTSVTIPNSVTLIGEFAFEDCSSLTSVTIPNSVTSLGYSAFSRCTSLTSVTIPNSITSLNGTFSGCKNLTSISIPNSITYIGGGAFEYCKNLTSVIIPNSVTTIGERAFSRSGLTSVTIPNSITHIQVGYDFECAFFGCSNLTSVIVENGNPVYDSRDNCNAIIETATNTLVQGFVNTVIPNSVTSIGAHAFEGCDLTSITIPNSVTSIGGSAFYECSGLTSVNIPNSVISLGYGAFAFCGNLTSVTIGNSVTSIGFHAFQSCNALSLVISKIDNPSFDIAMDTFSTNTYNNATLYVPKGTIDLYKKKTGWSMFHFIEEGDGGESHTEPSESTEPTQCEKPTISYQNGKLLFNCATEGATCHYSITDSDIKAGDGKEIQLKVTYNISVFATKEGCKTSETATATLCWIDVEPKSEGLTNGMAQVSARAVMVKTEAGQLIVEGAEDNTSIVVYSIDGVQVGSTTSRNGVASINTTLSKDSVAIVRIGNKSVKVIMR